MSLIDEKEELLKDFKKKVKDLVIYYNMEHKDIINVIHDTLLDEANKLPKIQVLYNVKYGGFGLSPTFKQFISTISNENTEYEDTQSILIPKNSSVRYYYKERIHPIRFIRPFALKMLEKYPSLFDIIYLYEKYKLSYGMKWVDLVINRRNEMERVEQRMCILQEYVHDTSKHGDKVLGTQMYSIQKGDTFYNCANSPFFKYEGFTKESYEQGIKYLEEYISNIDNNENLYRKNAIDLVGNIVFDEMISFLQQKTIKTKQTKDIQFNDKYSFAEALKEHVEGDIDVWEYQNSFCRETIAFLLFKREQHIKECENNNVMNTNVFDYVKEKQCIVVDEETKEGVLNQFELQLASDTYCSLKIDEVPQILDWSIGDYDGLENINLM
jgi:hypothetical protein